MSTINLYDFIIPSVNMMNWVDMLTSNFERLNELQALKIPGTLGEDFETGGLAATITNSGSLLKAQQISGRDRFVGIVETLGTSGSPVRVFTSGVVNGPWSFAAGDYLIGLDPDSPGALKALTAGDLASASSNLLTIVGVKLTSTKILLRPQVIAINHQVVTSKAALATVVPTPFTGQTVFLADGGSHGRQAYYATDNLWRYTADDSTVF